MKKTLQEEIDRMKHIINRDQLSSIFPPTIERDEDDIRNKPASEQTYRDQIIKKNWLGSFSTEVNGKFYMSNKEWKVKDFIDKQLDGE